jgi:hypothetical protein
MDYNLPINMKKHISNTLYLVIVIALILTIIASYKIAENQRTYLPQTKIGNTPTPSPRPYFFRSLKIQLVIPEGWTIVERQVSASLLSKKGRIEISTGGSFYDSLKEDLASFDTKNNIKVDSQKEVNIGGNNAVVREERIITDHEVVQKVYFFYKDYSIYSISTEDKSLYADLDTIAASFRFIQ